MNRVTVSADSVVKALRSICILLDDGNFKPCKEEQEAFGEMYVQLSDAQKEELRESLDCGHGTYSDDDGAYSFIVAHVQSGKWIVSCYRCGDKVEHHDESIFDDAKLCANCEEEVKLIRGK